MGPSRGAIDGFRPGTEDGAFDCATAHQRRDTPSIGSAENCESLSQYRRLDSVPYSYPNRRVPPGDCSEMVLLDDGHYYRLDFFHPWTTQSPLTIAGIQFRRACCGREDGIPAMIPQHLALSAT